MKRPVRGHSPPPDDPLERARLYSSDAKDIARDVRRTLPQYDADTEEITQNIHVHLHQQSSPDIEKVVDQELERKPQQWVKVVVGAAVTALLAWLANHFGSAKP